MFLYSEQPTTESVQEIQEPMQSLSAPEPQFVHSEQAGVPTQTKSSMVENSGKFFQRPEKMEMDKLVIINKDPKTKFVMYRNDVRVYILGENWSGKCRISNFKLNQFQLVVKRGQILNEFKNIIQQKMKERVDFYNDAKYKYVWPFLKVHNNETTFCVF